MTTSEQHAIAILLKEDCTPDEESSDSQNPNNLTP